MAGVCAGEDVVFNNCTFNDYNGAILDGSEIRNSTVRTLDSSGYALSAWSGTVVENCAISSAYVFDGLVTFTCSCIGQVDYREYEDDIVLIDSILAHPLFCGSEYTVHSNSFCLPENNDCGVLMGAWGEGCGISASIEETVLPDPVIAYETRLHSCCPNPFNPSTELSYTLSRPGTVRLTIYDVSGRRVRELVNEPQGTGPQSAEWDGRDDDDRSAPAGVYFARLEACGKVETRKLALVK